MTDLDRAIKKLRLYPIEERGIDHCNYIDAEDARAILQALDVGEKAAETGKKLAGHLADVYAALRGLVDAESKVQERYNLLGVAPSWRKVVKGITAAWKHAKYVLAERTQATHLDRAEEKLIKAIDPDQRWTEKFCGYHIEEEEIRAILGAIAALREMVEVAEEVQDEWGNDPETEWQDTKLGRVAHKAKSILGEG